MDSVLVAFFVLAAFAYLLVLRALARFLFAPASVYSVAVRICLITELFHTPAVCVFLLLPTPQSLVARAVSNALNSITITSFMVGELEFVKIVTYYVPLLSGRTVRIMQLLVVIFTPLNALRNLDDFVPLSNWNGFRIFLVGFGGIYGAADVFLQLTMFYKVLFRFKRIPNRMRWRFAAIIASALTIMSLGILAFFLLDDSLPIKYAVNDVCYPFFAAYGVSGMQLFRDGISFERPSFEAASEAISLGTVLPRKSSTAPGRSIRTPRVSKPIDSLFDTSDKQELPSSTKQTSTAG
ncbi:hypothetical protein HK105_208083 [Polyrhizophydium stewartii]|uniref:Uncharacterized protein n=1 Tax=Polyrhizophydium stewartii TaxID=2732419 RepID=A0ABR4MYW9_9FUNG|nr:hypothetical protein HK105_004523 [Polyrhizophydium stewartii]